MAFASALQPLRCPLANVNERADRVMRKLGDVHGRIAVGITHRRQKIAACGFAPLLDAVIISEEAGVTKPDPRIFNLALDALGRSPEDAVMIGDAWDTDIAGAQAAGIRPIWFNRFGAASPDPSVTEIRALKPAASVVSLIVTSA